MVRFEAKSFIKAHARKSQLACLNSSWERLGYCPDITDKKINPSKAVPSH